MDAAKKEDPLELEPPHTMIMCAVIIGVTMVVQATVLFSNSSFVLKSWGLSTLVIYIASAICFLMMPWFEAHMTALGRRIRMTRLSLLAFCFWIGSEESVHASHSLPAPEVVTSIAGVFLPAEMAGSFGYFVFIAATLGIIELLSHLQIDAIALFRTSRKRAMRTTPTTHRHAGEHA